MSEAARQVRWGPRGTASATIAARLVFEGVGHVYPGGVVALDGVSFAVEPGEIVSLLGHSGCGKTTLLRVAAGIEHQTSGRLTINEQEIAGPATFLAPEKRGIGLMFQDYALFPHMTILANVMYGLKKLPAKDAEQAARAALQRVGLVDFAGDYPHLLSGGEQQRVALARAIVPRPGVLLMDEPFSNLDKRMRDTVRDETVAVLREARMTTILVTHDPEEAMRIADRIVLMRAGRVVQIGTPEELYLSPKSLMAARFFSELSEVSGTAKGGEVDTPLGRFPARNVPDGPAAVCIRPQALFLEPAGRHVPGRIVRRHFLGEADLLEIVVENIDQPLKLRTRERGQVAVGQEVGVRIEPSELLVFAAGEA